ncbi:hypothetical protein GHT06_011552 [Daphnia sinensis]|uniref:Uncharacterized protein n=1 Tax=Daphnia sinensis TaxID=1820382 RepID=A0AAD5LE81_9CRUS|nr:hypothetical protein GHT06_011552 [Daphnia sinensis]
MADLERLLVLRSGSRVIAARLIERLKNVFEDEDMEPSRKIHELESKLAELKTRYETLEDLDQQIQLVTKQEDLQKEIEEADVENSIIQDAGDLCRYRINVLRRANPDVDSTPQPAPVLPSRATSRPKIALPRFNGDILQWQPFWQAFVAEIESDDSLADINNLPINCLVYSAERNIQCPNVLQCLQSKKERRLFNKNVFALTV